MPQGGKTKPRHDRETVMQAYCLHEEGMGRYAISRKLGIHHDTVSRWLNNPAEFDPYLDEVAITRALAGDVKVYDNLTTFERDEVHALLDETSIFTQFRDHADRITVNTMRWRNRQARRAA
jgi:hypothetical protein